MEDGSSQLSPVRVWLTHLDQQGKSIHTLAAYRRALAHFASWNQQTYGSDFNLMAVMPRDIRDWKTYQQTVEKAAPATINQRLVAVAQFFAWAHGLELIRDDPTKDIHGLRLSIRMPKAIKERALRQLLRAVHASGNVRDIALVELLSGTGLRVGEVLALQVGDLRISERSGTVTVRHGKGGGVRTVPLTVEVRHALTAYLSSFSDPQLPTNPLWRGIRGPLLHRSSILRLLHKYSHQAGIADVGPHTLRHTFATRYLAANPDDLRGLATLLGHASLDTVMIYTEPHMDELSDRVERMEIGIVVEHNR